MPTPPAPDFWQRGGLAAQLLQPLAWANAAAGAARRGLAHPWQAPVPVLCIGNLVAGGAGKTPVAIGLARWAIAQGLRPHCLSRGYGGRLPGPVAVAPHHTAAEVGDEPLLLAAVAPCWIARDRAAGARAAAAAGAGLIIMDDGFQNPGLAKDLSLLVVDGGYGFGNGRIIPAGPLREPLAAALDRADGVVVMGDDEAGVLPRLGRRRVLRARLAATNGGSFAGAPVIAFAGIGRPEKFFRSLAATGARLLARHAFADHHRYRETELRQLRAEAAAAGATLVTTAKDAARLPEAWRAEIAILEIAVVWQDEAALAEVLAPLRRGRADA